MSAIPFWVDLVGKPNSHLMSLALFVVFESFQQPLRFLFYGPTAASLVLVLLS